jgi:hypothetical protein
MASPQTNAPQNEQGPVSADMHELLVKAAQNEIDSQADAFNQLDTKSGVVLGFALVAIIQIAVTSLRVDNPFSSAPALVVFSIFTGTLFILAAIWSGVVARWPREFDHGPSIDELLKQAQTLETLQAAERALAQESIKKNYAILEKKVDYSNATSFFALLGLLAFVAAVIMLIIHGLSTPPQTA